MRYTTEWVYECILLRVKSSKTYKHLRRDKILILPSPQTLSKYLRHIKSTYGFHDYVFKGLKMKASAMAPENRRGILAIDEMKLSETVSFDRVNLKVEGFTDLGEHTPEHQKNQRGDHALVIMFQPYRGNFVQAIACFLSKGSASSTVLHKLILEAVILLEQSGLYIDAIVTDGAAWNRAMWKLFGVTMNRMSILHPYDNKRQLWFLSDFPHLAKIFRNFITQFSKMDKIFTPYGGISKKHWYALVEILKQASYEIRINYKLRAEHVDPKYYQKMNVALAFQFFNIYDALEIYENQHEDLEDCESTKIFCKRITDLIHAMNSRTPSEAMSPGNKYYKVVQDFIPYLVEWEKSAKQNNWKFLTENCFYGLLVSLKATLEICDFLTSQCNFNYVMTARLNQDCLERFFGMMRESCGANDHPDSVLFIQMYKLISTYSLIKPPKGCNVEGKDILETLLALKDITDINERQEHWEGVVDTVLDKRNGSHLISEATQIMLEHDYTLSETSEYALSYISGYVSRKGSRFAKFIENGKPFLCNDCIESLILSPSAVIPERHKLIEIKSRGGLMHPSVVLYNLISRLETATLKTIKNKEINVNTFGEITGMLEELSPIPFVGCSKHLKLITRRVMTFYLTMRMHFICKKFNKTNNEIKEMTREKRKASKLTTGKRNINKNNVDTSKDNACDSLFDFKQGTTRKRKSCNKENLEPKNKKLSCF